MSFRQSYDKWREYMRKKLDIGAITELKTSVGMNGSSKQEEVKGPLVAGAAIGLILINIH